MTRYAYSFDEEVFTGIFPTPEDAARDAFADFPDAEIVTIYAHGRLSAQMDSRAEIDALKADNALMKELLEAWYYDTDIPDSNCSCHISPPCNDCVEWGGLREAAETTKRLLEVK